MSNQMLELEHKVRTKGYELDYIKGRIEKLEKNK